MRRITDDGTTISEKERAAERAAVRGSPTVTAATTTAGTPHPCAVSPRRLPRTSANLEAELAEAVQAARDAEFSWSAIGTMLGVSKQTAQARYGR